MAPWLGREREGIRGGGGYRGSVRPRPRGPREWARPSGAAAKAASLAHQALRNENDLAVRVGDRVAQAEGLEAGPPESLQRPIGMRGSDDEAEARPHVVD